MAHRFTLYRDGQAREQFSFHDPYESLTPYGQQLFDELWDAAEGGLSFNKGLKYNIYDNDGRIVHYWADRVEWELIP